MRSLAGGVIFGWLFLWSWCASACGDGGTVRISEKRGGFLITIFTAPAPFRAGPVDISVLVQDALTGEPVPQTPVIVRMTKPGQLALEYPATREAATNKLLHAARFELPEPGCWQLEVQVEGVHEQAVISGEVEAAERLPRWRELWPWIAWPALAIASFATHQLLARQRSGKPSRRGAVATPTAQFIGQGKTAHTIRTWQDESIRFLAASGLLAKFLGPP